MNSSSNIALLLFIISSLISTFLCSQNQNKQERISLKSENETDSYGRLSAFQLLGPDLLNHLLNYVTFPEKSFLCLDKITYANLLSIRKLRFFQGIAFDIPELADISVSEPELKHIQALKSITSPYYVYRALLDDLVIFGCFEKLRKPLCNYLARYYNEKLAEDDNNSGASFLSKISFGAIEFLPNPLKSIFKGPRLLPPYFEESLNVIKTFIRNSDDFEFYLQWIDLFHGKIELDVFSLTGPAETRAFKIIFSNPSYLSRYKSLISTFSVEQKISWIAHSILNHCPELDLFDRILKKRMFFQDSTLQDSNIFRLIVKMTEMFQVPYSEYEYLYTEINRLIDIYPSDTKNDQILKMFNDVRYGNLNDIGDDVSFFNELSIDFAFRASLANKQILLESIIPYFDLNPFRTYLNYHSSLIPNNPEFFKFLFKIIENTPDPSIRCCIYGQNDFSEILFSRYICNAIDSENNIAEFVLEDIFDNYDSDTPADLVITGLSLLLRFCPGIKNQLRFSDEHVYGDFIIYTYDFFGLHQPNLHNIKYFMGSESLRRISASINLRISFSKKTFESALNHSNYLVMKNNQEGLKFLISDFPLYSLHKRDHIERLIRLSSFNDFKSSLFSCICSTYRLTPSDLYFSYIRHISIYILKSPYKMDLNLLSHSEEGQEILDLLEIEFPNEFSQLNIQRLIPKKSTQFR